MIRTRSSTHSRHPAVSRQVIVLETDGFSVRAALVRREGKKDLVIEGLTQSSLPDPIQAAEEALDALQKALPRLPRRAIVVSVEVTPALLHLPIAPNGRAPEQMQKALRWEMEPRVAQRAGSRQVGGILVGLGVVPHQVEELLKVQEERRAGQEPGGRTPRLGELATELGYASSDQVKSAVELQKWFTAEDVDLACGWSVVRSGSAEGRHPWLVASLCRERRQRWKDLLRKHGLELEGVYPLAGSAGPVLAGGSGKPCACIQLERGLMVHAKLRDGCPEALEVHYLGEKSPSPWECFKFLAEESLHTVWICGRGVEPFASELSSLNGCHPSVLRAACEIPPDGPVAPDALVPLVGAARHALGLAPGESAVCVPARDPAPPLRRRAAFWWIAAAACTGLACAGTETLVRQIRNASEEQTRQDESVLEARKAERRERLARAGVAENLTRELGKEEERLRSVMSQLEYCEKDLPMRARFLPGLLDALSLAVTDEVVIESLDETRPYCVELKGWALTDQAAHQFYRTLSGRLEGMGMELLEQSTRSREGNPGAGTYSMHAVYGLEGMRTRITRTARDPSRLDEDD